jgi:ABC-type transport system involved in cytochrome c biogenesis ATPase subunit
VKLEAIRLNSFLSFEEFEWAGIDRHASFLVGPNGAGKTNLFRAIQCAVEALGVDRAIWQEAGHNGANSFLIELDLRLESAELELLATFLAAAMCDRNAVQEALSTTLATPDFRQAVNNTKQLSASVLEAFGQPAWLEAGTLRVSYEGNGRWSSEYITRSIRAPFIVALEGSHAHSIRLKDADPQRIESAFSAWWSSMGEVMQWDWIEHLQGRRPNPGLPNGWLKSDSEVRLFVYAPEGNMPSHDALEQLLGRKSQSFPISTQAVFHHMLASAFRFSQNVRVAPRRYFPAIEAHGSAPDLTTGEKLALYLYHTQLAADAKSRVFSSIGSAFKALIGDSVRLEVPTLTTREAQEHSGDLAIDVRIGDHPGILLPFAGAGVGEALYIAAMLSNPKRVVLLDEPAANLHPTVQRRLARLVTRQHDSQYLVSTHSPSLLIPEVLKRAGRVYKQAGQSIRAAPSVEWLGHSDRAALDKELRRSSDLRALLFERGVILVEGESELGALPIWYEELTNRTLDEDDIGIFSVGGHFNFGTHVGYLDQFRVPWAIICDGAAIGDAGNQCSIANQLAACGHDLDLDLASLMATSFLERKQVLRDQGVFTLAAEAADELESAQVFIETRPTAVAAVGSKSKVRIAQYTAENSEWHEAGEVVTAARNHVMARIEEA